MSRVDNIMNYKKNQETAEQNRLIQQKMEQKRLIEEVKLLKPRIDQLLEVGNACRDAGIPLDGRAFGQREDYTTHQFITNSWSHLVGFVDRGNHSPFKELGINGGGACGPWNFRTNGIQVYEAYDSSAVKIQEPQINHLKEFLTNFDTLEKSFYDYVDKVTEKNKDVVPLDPEKDEALKPVEISGTRLSVLAYNAIVLLEDNGFTPKDLMKEIGITAEEYKAILGKEAQAQEALRKPSLNDQIQTAANRSAGPEAAAKNNRLER